MRVIDAHLHCSASSVHILVRALDIAEIDGAVVLAFPGESRRLLEEAHRVAPRRLRVLVSPILQLAGTGSAWESELAEIDRLLGHAAGIKLYKDANFGLRNRDGKPISLLSPELEPLWAIAAAHDKPLLMHCADPSDFWRRSPRLRARQLEIYPEWSYRRSRAVPSRRWMTRSRDELFRREPSVRFVSAHLGGFPATPGELGRFMGLGLADTSAALEEVLTFDRYAVDRLLRRHEHDIMWGSDLILGAQPKGEERSALMVSAKFLADSLKLATAEEPVHAPASAMCPWTAPGLGLRGSLRESILSANAIRIYWNAR
jgi:predicted TIM-barrel fold metal-dependent hydrolase